MAMSEGQSISIPPFVPESRQITPLIATRLNEVEAIVCFDGDSRFIDPDLESLSFYIAPKEPAYTVDDLNGFTHELTTGIEGLQVIPSKIPEEEDIRKVYAMDAGRINYTEHPGRAIRIVQTTDVPTFLKELGYKGPRSVYEVKDTARFVSMYVVPHPELIEAIKDPSRYHDVNREDVRAELVDLKNGYIRREWLERLKEGIAPFQDRPTVSKRLQRGLRSAAGGLGFRI